MQFFEVVESFVAVISVADVVAVLCAVVVGEAVVPAVVGVVVVVWIGTVSSPRWLLYSVKRPTDVKVAPSPGANGAIPPDITDPYKQKDSISVLVFAAAARAGGRST